MARGPQGGLIRDEASLLAAKDRADGSGLARRFGVNMPDGALPGIQMYGRSVMAAGETLMATSADWIAQRNAENEPIARDPETGAWTRPATPPIMGLRGRAVYDRIMDQRFQETVFRDVEANLNQIAAENQYDPARAHALMTGFVEGTMKGLEPRFQNLMAPNMQREVSERHRGILAGAYARERALTQEHFRQEEAYNLDRALTAGALGDYERQAEHVAAAHAAIDRQAELEAIHPDDVARRKEAASSVINGGAVLQRTLKLLADGALTPEDFAEIAFAIRFGQGGAHGIIGQSVLRHIPDQKVRDALASQIEMIGRNATDRVSANKTAQSDAAALAHYKAGHGDRPHHLRSDADFYDFAYRWAEANGVKALEPEGIVMMAETLKEIPTRMVEDMFNNFRAASTPEARARLRAQFAALRSVDMEHLVPDDARWVVRNYEAAVAMTGDSDLAWTQAMAMYEKNREGIVNRDQPRNYLRDAISQPGAIKTDAQVAQRINATMDAQFNGRFAHLNPFNRSFDIQKLSAVERNHLYSAIQMEMVQLNDLNPGSVFDQAVDIVARRFFESRAQDPLHPSVRGVSQGVIPKDEATPAVNDPTRNGATSRAYIENFVNRLVTGEPGDENPVPIVPREQSWGTTGELVMGVNTFLVFDREERGDRIFRLVYQEGGGYLSNLPLRDKDGNEVRLNLSALQRDENEEIRAQMGRWLPEKIAYEQRLRAEGASIEELAELVEPRLPDYDGWGSTPVERVLVGSPAYRGGPTYMQPPRDAVAPGGDGQVVNPRGMPRDDTPDMFEGLEPPRRETNMGGGPVHLEPGPAVTRTLTAVRDRPDRNVRDLQPTFQVGLANMFEAMPDHIRRGIRIGSTVRSTDEQRAIYRRSRKGYAARPGHSKHETGHAVDLKFPGGEEARQWVHDNAHLYGLHFPLMAQAKGIPYEPWHIEPIDARPNWPYRTGAARLQPKPTVPLPPPRPNGWELADSSYTGGDY
jgi:hypothetical protein